MQPLECWVFAPLDPTYETDHYKGWPAVLVRLKAIGTADLRHRLERAWRLKAPKRLVAELNRKRQPRAAS